MTLNIGCKHTVNRKHTQQFMQFSATGWSLLQWQYYPERREMQLFPNENVHL